MTADRNGRDGNSGSFDPAQAARSAVAAAAVGAAVGALRAFTARQSETQGPPEDDERIIESDEELTDEEQLDEPGEPDREQREEEPVSGPEPGPGQPQQQQRQEEPKPEPAPPGQLLELSERARDAVRELRGVEAEAISGLERAPNGWTITLEVVELHRIPESTDVLASYEVELAEDGGLVRFERARRYYRSQSDDGVGR
jgi:gas vesicle protein GvpO